MFFHTTLIATSCAGRFSVIKILLSHLPTSDSRESFLFEDITCAPAVSKQEKSCGKARQGPNQVKETIQEYIAGAETVTEDPATRDYVVMRARLMAAKSVPLHLAIFSVAGRKQILWGNKGQQCVHKEKLSSGSSRNV